MTFPNVLPVSYFHLASSHRWRGSLKGCTDLRMERGVFPCEALLVLLKQDGLCWCRWDLQLRTKPLPWYRESLEPPAQNICDFQPSQQQEPLSRAQELIPLSFVLTAAVQGWVELSPVPTLALPTSLQHKQLNGPFPAALTPPESRQPLASPPDLLNCHFSLSTISTIYLLERKLPYEVLLK